MSTYDLELTDANNGVVIAALGGELDLTNARELEERLDAAAPSSAVLVLDVNRVVFIDSAALHVLFRVARRRETDRMAIAMEPTAAISRTLAIVRMHDAVRIVQSLDELDVAEID